MILIQLIECLFLSPYHRFRFPFIVIIMVSCSGNNGHPWQDQKISQIPVLSYAKRLKLDTVNSYSQVSVYNPWQGAVNVIQKWYLLPRGNDMPEGIDTTKVIRVPVKKIICMSTTHLAMISALGETASVTGFSGTGFIYNGDLLQRVENGSIREIGYEDNLNKELILRLNPDLVMIYGVGGESSGYIGKLKELGVKVFFNADHLEPDPLGKAEWIRLFGALYCKEEMADSIFRSIEEKYNRICDYIVRDIDYRPDVLLGLPFKDTWYISPGNSYISKLIYDAGGNYLWKDKESQGAEPTGLENVYLKALNADFWLNIGTAESKAEIISVDPRLADLRSFKKGNLYNNTKRSSKSGGNDYWEGGSMNPQTVLMDIATILHPELFPDSGLFYYRKIN